MENTLTKENPALCYQCAKCSTGCPISEEMDLLPHQVIHMLSLGMRERALLANTYWFCAGCYACAVRCPNDIDVTSVMDDLRAEAIERGIRCPRPELVTFHRAFLQDIARRGRVHEMRMMGEFNLRSGKPFNNVLLAPRLFLKGRLHLLPRGVRGFRRWIKRLWKR